MTLRSKISFAVGYSTYAVFLYSILVGQPDLVMGFAFYVPGPLFAAFILLFTTGVTINRGLTFFVFCCGLYYSEVYCLVNQIVDKNQYQLLIPSMSCIGAISVSLAYSLLFKQTLDFKKDIFKAAIIGLQVSILTTLASFLDPFSNDMIDELVAVGFYSIFPFWIVSMSKHLLSKNSA